MNTTAPPAWARVALSGLVVAVLAACSTTVTSGLPHDTVDAGTDADPSDTPTNVEPADAGPTADAAADADPLDPADADAGTPDALDADLPDTPLDADQPDADPDPDADPWTGTPCAVNGTPGVCMDAAACTGDQRPNPGHCPGPAEIQCCTPIPDGQTCDETAMPRPNEGLAQAPGVGGCPNGMVPVADFCVDQYEGALVELLDGGQERSWSPFFHPGSRRMRAVSIAGAVPQSTIDQLSATAACAEAGKRLCTDVEWLRACQGPDTTTFPYGPTRQDGVCNDARAVHPAVEYFGTSEAWIFSELENPCLNQLPDALATTGAFTGCESAEGVFDMMGNLHEWTADPAGTFRGGFYVDTVRNGPGCLYRTTAHDVGHRDYSTGFRCCADRP